MNVCVSFACHKQAKTPKWLACLQENVAMVCNVDDLVSGALQGFAVTVFAFGQTGSVSLLPQVCFASKLYSL